jgi:glycine betaine/proline transport system ATP-binding protein
VLRPANDYIAKFVKEVNRGRVVHVEAIMERGPAPGGREIPASTVLDDAARLLLANSGDRLSVVDESGRPIGSVGLEQIAAAMVGEEEPGTT